jgi:hypothetical protein
LLVADQARIEVELERFGVIGEVVIRRRGRAAAGIADARANDGWVTPEPGVWCPESTEAERGGLDGNLREIERLHHAGAYAV